MREFRRLTLIAVAAISLFPSAEQQSPRKSTCPLKEALSGLGISQDGWDADLLACEIFFGFAKERSGKDAVAFGTEGPGANPLRTLHIAVRDGRTGRWHDHETELVGEAGYQINVGSINGLWMHRGFTFVDTHNTPSRSTTAVLDEHWRLVHIVDGGVLDVFQDGTVLYQKGQPHFVPVHPLELGVFNPNSLDERIIYPTTPPGPVRTAFREELQRAFDAIPADWFRIHNHPGSAERLSEYIKAVIAVKERFGITLFVNSVLDGRQFDPVNRSQDRNRDVELITVLRYISHPRKTQYREIRADALRQQIPFATVDELASPETIERIFALPYP
ncbi:MAG: hypothetical protein HUU46_16810 [Candidatus Hydrogenedentes bacterium]|nr:hypothetical protein [Candidatus Hydrogenedentota bacterium]